MSILVFIPAYNCEKQIVRVLSQITPSIVKCIDEVLIVDNCSLDNTVAAACEQLKNLSIKTIVLKNRKNYGYGGSMKVAISYAIENSFDYLLVLHGDDQAHIGDFEQILSTKQYQEYDAIFGARFHPGSRLKNYSKFRTFGNRVLNYLCSMLVSYRIYDLGSGLNLYKVEKLSELPYQFYPNNLTFDPHTLIDLIHRECKITNVPISWREEDQVSNARIFKQALSLLKLFALKKKGADQIKISSTYPVYQSDVVFTNK